MAFASTTQWDVRVAVGSDANGGGFDSAATGTDRSQAASAFIAFTDLVIDGTTNTKCTSAAHPFDSTSPGNIINVTGGTGFTVQRVQVVSVAAGVATVDKSLGTLGSTGGTGNLGGSLATIAAAEALVVAGNTIWIKYDNSNPTTLTNPITLSSTSGNSTNGIIWWRGYDATHGDYTGNRPLITTSTNNKDLILGNASGNIFRAFDNLHITSTAGTPGNGIASSLGAGCSYWIISHCVVSGCKSGINADNVTYFKIRNLQIFDCDISSCTANAVSISDDAMIDGCYLHSNSGWGVLIQAVAESVSVSVRLIKTVVYGNILGGCGMATTASASATNGSLLNLDHCAIISNTADGVTISPTSGNFAGARIENTIIYGNGGYGVNLANSAAFISMNRNNAYGSNTSGNRNNFPAGTNDVALSADPFTARTSNDFSLNSTAGGGAACKAVGFPGSIPGLVTAGFADIGPLQSQAGGGLLKVGGMTGGMQQCQ